MTTTKKTRTAAEQAAHRAEFIEHLARTATDADLAHLVENGGITQRMADEAKAARPEPTKAETTAATVLAGAYLLMREHPVIQAAAAERTALEFANWCAASPIYDGIFTHAVLQVAAAAEATE